MTVDIGGAAASTPAAVVPVSDPAALVNPLAGTGAAPVAPGNVGEFPGADLPFGMIQWSPDTTPDRVSGSGYSYTDSRISGFSFTHMSGTGCASYGDVPVLPTTGPIGADPEDASAPFSHSGEQAAPGRYEVTLGHPAVTTDPGGDHEDRPVPVQLPLDTCGQRASEAGGERQRCQRRQLPHRRRRRDHRSGDERSVLRHGHPVHLVLRGPLQPAVLVRRRLERCRRHPGEQVVCREGVRGICRPSTPRPITSS